MNRAWFYQRMTADATLMALVPGGIHQTTKVRETPHQKPYLMYRTIAHRPSDRGDDRDIANIENYLVFVHDVPGDYLKIDAILARLKYIFVDAKDQAAGISRVFWLEDSEDFRDEDMGTILRYARFSVRYLAPQEG